MLKQDEIIDMAKSINEDWWLDDIDLQAFAKLVAKATKEQEYEDLIRIIEANVAAEREACAKVCEWYSVEKRANINYSEECALGIRARGQT